ncbi:Protein of unknown function [Lactobacillus helveticus CIRM-BIA 101]|uniref:Uncharacterized protein n=3 Tax=Lactobacillus helveticus TaxID=1587 RepID=U4QGS9_LACHE|nr:Protein of unknown function [Lactobacillus helveticus CIRM-BIA 953]CDI57788.1 Protein of unknown function [Lactobacillus helveticus CIRM-BIA 951]CDI59457.1 Protein of unknown function [Lactobacillus helveticus CIRM-BIA 104]CDI63843.1 Protein of unknown function [Lactobacillus helveticus CIRM-BIA 103]CDI65282.1 Protein of unknown function [Lactobacillus helveticus CIRM-BIA 101]
MKAIDYTTANDSDRVY